MDENTFQYLKPTDEQTATMGRVRAAATVFGDILEQELPDGPDKEYVIRAFRTAAMWANISITRDETGAPRE